MLNIYDFNGMIRLSAIRIHIPIIRRAIQLTQVYEIVITKRLGIKVQSGSILDL